MTTTGLVLGASRTAGYVAVALVLGGLCFVALVWRPALRSIRGVGAGEAVAAFSARARRFAMIGCALGAAGAAGILVAGHRASASTAWLFVELACWPAIAALLRRHLRSTPFGSRPEEADSIAAPLVACVGLAALAVVLAGEPSSAFVGALTAVHLVAASVWVGGVVYLALVIPAALGRLDRRRHADLLVTALARFSPLALGSVIAIVLTGTVHTAVVLPRVSSLWGSAFGRLIVLKLLLVGLLVGLGWLNRYRVIPGLAAGSREPRRATILARRALAGEVVAMVVVLAATAALVAAAPASRSHTPYPYAHVDPRRSAP